MELHVVICKEDLDPDGMTGKVAVVLDVIFATSTIVAAFYGGATGVRPALGREEAERFSQERARDELVLIGEYNSITLPGFIDPLPLALLKHGVAGKEVIFASTNGTVALRRASKATAVYAAALLNAEAVAEHLVTCHAADQVILACAGSLGRFSFEDFFGAGAIVAQIVKRLGSRLTMTDAALAAHSAYRGSDALTGLRTSSLGQEMIDSGRGQDVDFAARENSSRCIPVLRGNVLCRLP
ncbi:MAG: 2-phosphosulfolactate phosphatase [Azonexus sp.]|jgi:2-phosphosulfolactate phosphatase|nr:2-phosphosulfolactate phosphatase [Azonexus sp.]